MQLKELNERPGIDQNVKLKETYVQFEKLLSELRKRALLDGVVVSLNKDIDELNATSGAGDDLKKLVRKKQTAIIRLLEKELKLVPKNYYRTLWLSIGMAAFGIPMGVAFGAALGNMAFLGIGLPIGLGVGIAVGAAKDKKAFDEGRQLDLEIKY